ncbi:MAG: hypothetical protein WC755_02155 [Candidatus Woesearchaeota archaeon]|jgi:acyl carrier protein
MKNFISDLIKKFLSDKKIFIEINDDTALMSSGILDSMDIFAICLDIQKKYNFKYFDFESDMHRIDTINGIYEVLNEKKQKT